MAFVETYCPVVVQLEAMAGGVQVLGPPLRSNAVMPLPLQWGGTHGVTGHRHRPLGVQGRRRHREVASETRGGPPLKKLAADVVVPRCSGTSKLWLQALPSVDVPRSRLFQRPVCRASAQISTSNGRLEEGLLDALWLRHHRHSLNRVVNGLMRRYGTGRKRRRETGESTEEKLPSPRGGATNELNMRGDRAPLTSASPTSVEWSCTSPNEEGGPAVGGLLSDAAVISVFPWFTFQSTPALPEEVGLQFNVLGHLKEVLETTLLQCSRVDLRGLAIRHTGYIEERWRRQQQGMEARDVQRLAAPTDVVVSYLRSVFSTLRWVFPAGRSPLASASSFWGVDAESADRVLNAFCATLQTWLSAGRRAIFPVAHFLHGVPVGKIPWLAGFYTPQRRSNRGTSAKPRRQRSITGQRLFMQYVLFITQHIIPFLIHKSYAVTWSSKNTHRLLFFPHQVWRRVVRREVRLLQGVRATPNAASTAGGLCHVGSVAAIRQRAVHSTLGTTISPSLLYAGVRFRPDGKKLRPIAVLRSASVRSLEGLACGAPGPDNDDLRLLCLLHRFGWLVDAPAAEEVFYRLRNAGYRGRGQVPAQVSPTVPPETTSQRGRFSHTAALRQALQCLMCGVEERRSTEGLTRLSNHCHLDEYSELLSFCLDARNQLSDESSAGCEMTDHHRLPGEQCFGGLQQRLTLVRSDASRCYDSLPQSVVMETVEKLVPYNTYHVLCFTAVFTTKYRGGIDRHNTTTTATTTSAAGVGGCPSSTPPFRGGCLRSRRYTRMVPSQDVRSGALPRIPRGWVLWEEATTASSLEEVSGSEVRAVLHEHLTNHLVVLDRKLHVQRCGILQGSPVAMLLCDELFTAVDRTLSGVLCEHEERSLLLRRVDDVLVASMSPIAGQRCLGAMRRGWPEVGYTSHPLKMQLCSGEKRPIPWCGLLIDGSTMEVSVEWQRMVPLLPSLRVSDASAFYCGDAEPVLLTYRFFSVIQLRVPPTAVCGRMNSHRRVLQTFYEVCLIWARLVLDKVQEALPRVRWRTVELLARPITACVHQLWRLQRRHHRFLRRHHSFCPVSMMEIQRCVLTALHRTLQTKLRGFLHRVRRIATRSSRDSWRQGPRRRCSASRSLSVDLLSFWWVVAAHVRRATSDSLVANTSETTEGRAPRSHALTSTTAATVRIPTSFSAPNGEDKVGLGTALLREVGPNSLHHHAAVATRMR